MIGECAVFADQQVEVLALFSRELEKDLFALRVFEALAVALEEIVRASFALDADEQRLLVVDPFAQLCGAFVEQAVGRAFEEQKGRPRFEVRVGRNELAIALLERGEMLVLLGGKPLKDRLAAGVLRQIRRPLIEFQAAALGRDRDPQCVPGEYTFGRRTVDRSGTLGSGPTLLADSVDLDNRLRGPELPGGGDLFDERLDVRAEKLG